MLAIKQGLSARLPLEVNVEICSEYSGEPPFHRDFIRNDLHIFIYHERKPVITTTLIWISIPLQDNQILLTAVATGYICWCSIAALFLLEVSVSLSYLIASLLIWENTLRHRRAITLSFVMTCSNHQHAVRCGNLQRADLWHRGSC